MTDSEIEWARKYIRVLEELLHSYRLRIMELEAEACGTDCAGRIEVAPNGTR